MAKPTYFTQGHPDLDDLTRLAAVDAGVVPSTCLLGGVLLEASVGKGEDPCAVCDIPTPPGRGVCGGRPARPGAKVERSAFNDSAESRRLKRAGIMSELEGLIARRRGDKDVG